MILVLLGTQQHKFDRLLKIIDNIVDEKVIVQIGNNDYDFKNNNVSKIDFFTEVELEEMYTSADILITHGGVGSILNGLKHEKKILALPRKKEYKEHVNDHQQEIVNKLVKNNHILELDTKIDINTQIKNIRKENFVKYKFNNTVLLDDIKKHIV